VPERRRGEAGACLAGLPAKQGRVDGGVLVDLILVGRKVVGAGALPDGFLPVAISRAAPEVVTALETGGNDRRLLDGGGSEG
jgi:hypothetical protein